MLSLAVGPTYAKGFEMVGKFESNKDVVQDLTESGAQHVGNIAAIVAGAVKDVAVAVKDVTRELGEWISDGVEMVEAARAARADKPTVVDEAE